MLRFARSEGPKSIIAYPAYQYTASSPHGTLGNIRTRYPLDSLALVQQHCQKETQMISHVQDLHYGDILYLARHTVARRYA